MPDPEIDKIVPPRKRKVARYVIAGVVLAALVFGGIRAWRYFGTYEATDDAQIDGHINSVSGRITGNVIDIRAEDAHSSSMPVIFPTGSTPRIYEVALAGAEADLNDAEAALEGSRIDIPITTTNTASQLSIAKSSRADATAFLAGTEQQRNCGAGRLRNGTGAGAGSWKPISRKRVTTRHATNFLSIKRRFRVSNMTRPHDNGACRARSARCPQSGRA